VTREAVVPRTEQVALVDLLDRVLSTGVVIAGDVTLAIAGVDLVHISLRALVASASTVGPWPQEAPADTAEVWPP
jgi:hypothetical protein